MYWIAMGGLAFWLPAIVQYVISGENTNWVSLNVGSLSGLVVLELISRVCLFRGRPALVQYARDFAL
jgi:hypothetical protein